MENDHEARPILKVVRIEIVGFGNILWLLLVLIAFALGFSSGTVMDWWRWVSEWGPPC